MRPVQAITAVGEPLGLGVDAPMWWSACEGGGRRADARLRKRYGIASGTVQSGNSLQGAALIGGALLASTLREVFPGLRITESHPKALLLALRLDETRFADRYQVETGWCNEHERDAAIAAVCAREGFEGRWSTDLVRQRARSEQDPCAYWLAPMAYSGPKPYSGAKGRAPGAPRRTTRFATLPRRGCSSPALVRRSATRMAHATALRTGPSSCEPLHARLSIRDQYEGLFLPPGGPRSPHGAELVMDASVRRTQPALCKIRVSRDTRSARMILLLPAQAAQPNVLHRLTRANRPSLPR